MSEEAAMLQPGDRVPDFSLEAGTGETVETAQLQGRRWVIYFYPKDHTPGCAMETGEFGRALPQFEQRGVTIFGCSVGEVAAKTEFAAACGVPGLPLLADPDHRVAEQFGAWVGGEGGRPGGVARCTFLVGGDGRVEQTWAKVTPAGHAAAVLAAAG
ncbi:MAG: peroxiredoxin [Candidatus Dormibacteria bacterium]